MDSLTHLLVGHAMGVAAISTANPHGGAVYWAVLVGNSLPDIDVPISLLVRRDIRLHRTATHTIPGAAILAATAALVISRCIAGAPFWPLFAWTLLGCLSHLTLDALNLFGARLLWPFSGRAIGYGILHIFDPVLAVLLGVPTLGSALGILPATAPGRAFFLMGPYVLYRAITARRLYSRLFARGARRVRVVPWYSGWRYVAETAEAIEFGRWQKGFAKPMAVYPKRETPEIRATLSDPRVCDFLESAEYPYARVEEDEAGFAVIWGDALRQLRADFRPVRVRIPA